MWDDDVRLEGAEEGTMKETSLESTLHLPPKLNVNINILQAYLSPQEVPASAH